MANSSFTHLSGSFGQTPVNAALSGFGPGRHSAADVLSTVRVIKPHATEYFPSSNYFSTAKSAASDASSDSGMTDEDRAYFDTWGQGGGGIANPAAASNLDPYPYATISKLYNTDAKTAYQEALSNTAIQRQMDDFKRAGLNPMLASRYGGADGVGMVGNVLGAGVASAASGSVGSTSHGSSGYSSGGSTSGRGSSAKGVSDTMKSVLNNKNTQSAIASVASAATTAITKNFALGAAAYYGVQSAFQLSSSIGKLFSRK